MALALGAFKAGSMEWDWSRGPHKTPHMGGSLICAQRRPRQSALVCRVLLKNHDQIVKRNVEKKGESTSTGSMQIWLVCHCYYRLAHFECVYKCHLLLPCPSSFIQCKGGAYRGQR